MELCHLILLLFHCMAIGRAKEETSVLKDSAPSLSPETPFMYAVDVGSAESKHSLRDLGPPPPELPLALLERLRQAAERSPEGRVVGLDVRIVAGFSPQETAEGSSSQSVDALKHFAMNKIIEHLPRTFLIPEDKEKGGEKKDVFINPDDRKFPFIYDFRYWKKKSTL